MPNILLLSDNEAFANDLAGQIALYAGDFTVMFAEEPGVLFDLAVIDGQSAGAREFRGRCPGIPLIFLTREEPVGLEESALNKIMFKPLVLEDFLNQIKSGINLLENSADGYLTFNRYELRPVSREILNLRNNEVVKLTEKEVAIIKYLYKARDKIVSKNELLQEVWGYSPDVTTHTIETHIYRLRQKVEHEDASAQLILTEDGGYKLKTA